MRSAEEHTAQQSQAIRVAVHDSRNHTLIDETSSCCCLTADPSGRQCPGRAVARERSSYAGLL